MIKALTIPKAVNTIINGNSDTVGVGIEDGEVDAREDSVGTGLGVICSGVAPLGVGNTEAIVVGEGELMGVGVTVEPTPYPIVTPLPTCPYTIPSERKLTANKQTTPKVRGKCFGNMELALSIEAFANSLI